MSFTSTDARPETAMSTNLNNGDNLNRELAKSVDLMCKEGAADTSLMRLSNNSVTDDPKHGNQKDRNDESIVVENKHHHHHQTSDHHSERDEEEGFDSVSKTGVASNTHENTKNAAVADFIDHFTLSLPSSTIRYRQSQAAARVIEADTSQFVLEETFDPILDRNTVEIRQIYDATEGVQMLRFAHVIGTLFWTGFLFVFCVYILLFLFLDLALQLGLTNKVQNRSIFRAIGALLGFPPLVYGLSSALVLAGAFVKDCWRGHVLIRKFALRNFGPVAVEWIFFAFFVGIPVFVMCIALLAGSYQWWKLTLVAWFTCVALFYALFTINVIIYEMRTCWNLSKRHYPSLTSLYTMLKNNMILRQVYTYSGTRQVTYLAKGTIEDTEHTNTLTDRTAQLDETVETSVSLYTKFTLWKRLSASNDRIGLFDHLEGNSEERLYSFEDARDVRPFVTYNTWGLEKVFCRPHNSRYIVIVKGPDAITRDQVWSSMACSVLGTVMIFLVIISFLSYAGLGASGVVFGVFVAGLYAIPRIRSTYKLYGQSRKIKFTKRASDQSNMADLTQSEGVYFVQENYRIAKPTVFFCWLMFAIELILFYFWPLISLSASGNLPMVGMYIIFVGITSVRYYNNAALVVEEAGHMKLVGGSSKMSQWRKQSRLNEIIGNISRGRGLYGWMSVLGFVGFGLMLLMAGTVKKSSTTGGGVLPARNYTSQFEYLQTDSLRYPSCQLSNDLGLSPLVHMADYAFLAGLAYFPPDGTQRELDEWFNRTAFDREDVVQEYRKISGTPSAVSFKLVTFPQLAQDARSFAYILIRGTQNYWDMLTDVQLWSAAALMQGLRELLPFGAVWTPIIPELIRVITVIESNAIDRVSFYKVTSDFAMNISSQTDKYAGVALTGHSLGGGLSIISGAQTGIPAVALSGPNAMLSRKSFDPPIKKEDLNKHTFNIIPERDVVAMLDDKAQNFQAIRCMADFEDVIGCHSDVRSLCEILYTCGSHERPIPCLCVTSFGYPEPTPKQDVTTTFDDVCPS